MGFYFLLPYCDEWVFKNLSTFVWWMVWQLPNCYFLLFLCWLTLLTVKLAAKYAAKAFLYCTLILIFESRFIIVFQIVFFRYFFADKRYWQWNFSLWITLLTVKLFTVLNTTDWNFLLCLTLLTVKLFTVNNTTDCETFYCA